MNNYLKIYILLTLLIFTGCEDVEVAAPGNNQSNESVAPLGAIIWDENNVILDDEKAKLPENSAPGITIGRLNATDANPDDEFLSVNSLELSEEIVLYPNPSNDYININYDEEIWKLQIINMNGEKINIKPSTSSIDVSFLSKGIYILNFNNNFIKFVKN